MSDNNINVGTPGTPPPPSASAGSRPQGNTSNVGTPGISPPPSASAGQMPKRGALATPLHVLESAAPHIARLGAPPNYIVVPPQISMWGNDVHGDCVTAEEAFAKACNQPEIFISDQVVIDWATAHGVLEGAYIYQVLDWMRNDGFHQDGLTYNDGDRYSVDWKQDDSLRSAIVEGPVKIGIAADQLSTVWRNNGGRTGWFATGFNSDNNVDHCVSLCGYGTITWLAQQLGVAVPNGVDGGQPGYALFTWNSIGIIDVPSMLAITREAWIRIPTTIVKSGGSMQIFARGGDGAVWHNWQTAPNNGWSGWYSLGGWIDLLEIWPEAGTIV